MTGESEQHTAPPGPGPTQSYGWWQQRLAEEFFGPASGGKPVLFFIDHAELERLADSEVLGLGAAVSSMLKWAGNPYEPILDRAASWERRGCAGPPPILPLLAATVLAAANMRHDEKRRANAYYARLAEVVRPSWPLPGYEKILKDYYSDVVDLWILLDKWIQAAEGRRGFSTIRTSKTRSRIGYAQSQALIRASDHDAVTRFFRTDGFQMGEKPNPAALLRDFKIWGRNRPQLFSSRLREALASDADDALLAPLLAALAESWDGSEHLPPSDGRPQLRLLLACEDSPVDGWCLRWHALAVDGVEADTLKYGHAGDRLSVTAGPGDNAYILSGAVPDPAVVLKAGIKAQGQRLAARVPAGRHLVPFAENPVAGAWVETGELTTFEPYVFLVDRIGESRVRKLAEIADGATKWWEPEETSAPGWRMTQELKFTDGELLAEAVRRADLPGVHHVPHRRPRLSGGLRLRPDLGRSNYLVGGEPDVLLPELVGRNEEATLDGRPLDAHSSGPISLRGRGLAVGEHVLSSGGARVSFWLHALDAAPHAPIRPPYGVPSSGTGRIAVPLAGESWFLTAQGSFIPTGRPSAPLWWTSRAAGLRAGGLIQVAVPQAAVWLVVATSDNGHQVTLLREAEPDIGSLNGMSKNIWTSLALDAQPGKAHEKLWRRYREAALASFPRRVFSGVRP